MTTPVPDPVPVTPTDVLPPGDHLVDAAAIGNPIARALAAAVIAGLTAATTALTGDNDAITPAEWVAIVISFLVTGGAVWAIPTVPEGIRAHGKAITAAVVSALGVLGTGLADGNLTQPEVLMIITALLSGLVVSATPEIRGGAIENPLMVGQTGAPTDSAGFTGLTGITGPTGPDEPQMPPHRPTGL